MSSTISKAAKETPQRKGRAADNESVSADDNGEFPVTVIGAIY